MRTLIDDVYVAFLELKALSFVQIFSHARGRLKESQVYH